MLQLVYRGGFPMTNANVNLPTRMSMDPYSGVEREVFSLTGHLSSSAAQDLLPRLSATMAGPGSPSARGGVDDPGAVLTSDLVDRFRKSIWPPPSIPAFGSWCVSVTRATTAVAGATPATAAVARADPGHPHGYLTCMHVPLRTPSGLRLQTCLTRPIR
eukprot:COSAG05_NODE_1756_length_4142_cov_1.848627_2_plen_159_part_00